MKELNEVETKILDAMHAAILEKGVAYVYNMDEAVGSPDHSASGDDYSMCSYLNWGEARQTEIPTGPSCIIGHAVLGADLMTPERLETFEGESADKVIDSVRVGEVYPSSDFVIVMNRVQDTQDSLFSWGHAWFIALEDLTRAGYDVDKWRL